MAYNAGASSGNLVLISTQTASASSSISFTSGLTGYDRYKIVFYNVVTTGVGSIFLTYSTDGGSTYISTNYDQYGACDQASGVFGNGWTNRANFLLTSTVTNIANFGIWGECEFTTLQSASIYKNVLNTLYDGTVQWMTYGHNYSTTSAINALKFAPDAGTFDSGTFKLYGVVN